MRNKLFILVSLVIAFSMVLAACAPQTVEVIKTVEVEKETVKTVEIVKEGQTIIVTATPEPVAAMEYTSKDPTTFVQATIGDIETLDPALDYETAGGQVLQNVYETLITYDREKPTSFIPLLATEVPTVENGGISADGTVYTFKIRSGVKFHNGADLTPSDVAYTLQRGVLQGGYSGPQWLIAEPLFGVGNDDISWMVDPSGDSTDSREAMVAFAAANPDVARQACEDLKAKVVADDAAGTVTVTLAQSWGPFLATLAGFWGSVMDQDWTIENGGWDGSCDTWQNWYTAASDDESHYFNFNTNGTGPFMLESWTPGQEYVLARFDGYWRTEPMWEGGPSGPAALERVVVKIVSEWGTRFAMLQAGDADTVNVPRENIAQIDPLVGEMCDWDNAANDYAACNATGDGPFRLFKGGPPVARTDVFLTFNIATSEESPNGMLGSGKLDGNGIPADFFSDVHIRRAFNYCFDWDIYIQEVLQGEGVQSIGVSLPGMPGYDPNGPRFSYDPDKCAEEFQLADVDKDGVPAGEDPDDVWEVGFRMQVAFNTGNQTRQTIAEILAGNLADVNPKFQVEILGLPWPTFLRQQRASALPVFFSGWVEDIHDPHNWYQPYIIGTYGRRQRLPEDLTAMFTEYINNGVAESDPAKRAVIYQELAQKIHDEAPQIILALATARHYQQRWVQGYYYNPISPGFYFYTFSKK